MKRISVPIDCMIKSLTDLNVSTDQANDIIALFEVVDAGDFDVLVMPVLSFNHTRQLSRKEVLITLSAFWISVIGHTDSYSESELQGLGALRSLYFVAINLGYQDLAVWIAKYWEETCPLHGSESLELWT
ncbi:hypothetical protein [Moritella sp. F3]|uniref:hypothetical protein n=1 Tax=Moritella sp. F3 TaxID=2718882 RepID=UPI0018E15B7F|nr:hypothetical protein [Moritella sp. F3]GIC79477.1 hypothetical protein FMO001_42040 [Moritella sp. F1]GIC79755.1 hypothetical protein FMO003_00360 [Moritella sp. F3]